MNWLRDAWRRIGTPDAISWPAFWTTLVAGVVGGFANSPAPIPVGPRLAIVLVGQLILWVPLLLVRPLLVRNPGRPRPGLVLAAFLIGALVRAITQIQMLTALYGADAVNLVGRFGGILVNIGPVFLVTAVVLSHVRERRRQIGELLDARLRIERSIEGVSSMIAQRNTEAVQRVHIRLEDELAKLEGAQADQSLVVLQSTVADVVRPMSHELAQSLPERSEFHADDEKRAVPWSQVLDSAASGRPFRPLAAGAFVVWEFVGMVLIRPADWFDFLVLACLFVVGLVLANRVVEVVSRGRGPSFRIATTTVAAFVVCIALAATVPAFLGTTPSDIGVALGLAVLFPGFVLGVSVLTALTRERDQVIRDLQASSDELERTLVRQRQAQWFQQKALSRALHGPVQMAVTAAAIRLDVGIQSGTVQQGVLDQIRTELMATLDVLHESEGGVVTLAQGIDRMRATWDGVCSISDHVSQEARDVLAHDGVLRSIVIDIVTEAVSNAVWHGNATRASVRLDVWGEGADDLLVEVTTDGRGIEEQKRRGLGTQLLDECTLIWRREAGPAGDALTAVLPFSHT